MGTTEVGKLLVRLEVTQAKFEKQLKASSRTANKNAKAIETRFDKMNKNVTGSFRKMAKGGVASLAALATVAGIKGLVNGVREAANSIATMAAEAEQAGVSFEAFQELQHVAKQSKISVDAMTDGLKELQLRADEFAVTSKGPAAEAFSRLGFSADELKEKLQEPDKLFEEIIGRLQQLDKAAQIRVADELFGGSGGEQFVKLLDGGVESIRTMRKEAKAMGLIMSNDLAKKAIEVDKKFELLANRVGVSLKTAILTAVAALQDFLDTFREVENRATSTIKASVTSKMSERQGIENDLTGGKLIGPHVDRARNKIKKLSVEIINLNSLLMDRGELHDKPANKPRKDLTFTQLSTPGSSKSKPQVDELTRLIGLIKERTTATQAETAAQAAINPLIDDYGFQLEKARTVQELLVAAQKAGITVTPALAGQIDQLAESYALANAEGAAMADSQDKVRQSAEDFKSLGKSVMSGFIADLRAGKSGAEALTGALSKVADKLLDIGLDALFSGGGSGGGNIFSTILGGLTGGATGAPMVLYPHAKGGIAARGMPTFANGGIARSASIFGEAGAEAAVPLPDGRSIPVKFTRGGMGAGSTHVTIGISENNGYIKPFVENIARSESAAAASTVAQSVPAMVDARNQERQVRRIRPRG